MALAQRSTPAAGAIGLIMPGNVVGAGLHELAQALIAGRAAVIKPAAAEGAFFPEFCATLSEVDAAVGARVVVVEFTRHDTELAAALFAGTEAVVAMGSDVSIASLSKLAHREDAGILIGFGSRMGGALYSPDAKGEVACPEQVARALAHDVVLFEQRGCLSLHHVFVLTKEVDFSRRFARVVADEIEQLSERFPPTALPPARTAAIRNRREDARWRRHAGEMVECFEGPHLAWTVIHDPQSQFVPSPLGRTVTVSAVESIEDLTARLTPVSGALEAFAVAGANAQAPEVIALLRSFGMSWICKPGQMQSPPVDWRHGGGALLDFLGYRP